jgi:pimeloyl-ACP methyl ester carboxylesterase
VTTSLLSNLSSFATPRRATHRSRVPRLPRVPLLAVACVMTVGCQIDVDGSSDDEGVKARFEPGACVYPLGPGQVEGSTVRCGQLVVPMRHDGATKRELHLQVLRFGATPRADVAPLVWLQGGPGGDIAGIAGVPLTVSEFLTADREFIVYTQRGTGKAEPKLPCPELDSLPPTGAPTAAEREAGKLAALRVCQQRATANGVDLSVLSTEENADDLEDLRAAIGYPKLDLWGTSYGSLLSLETVRRHPSSVRLQVIDAIVPPQEPWLPESGRNFQAALMKLLARCDASAPCKAAFGDGRTLLTQASAALQQPLALPDFGVSLYSHDLIDIVFQLMYVPETYPAIPLLLDSARRRDAVAMERVLTPFADGLNETSETFSLLMFVSVSCQDQSRYQSAADIDKALQGVFPEVAPSFLAQALLYQEVCKGWPLPQAKKEPFAAVTSSLPTMVVSGELDPITPARYGDTALATLSNARHLVYPGGGHGNSVSAPCGPPLLTQFLADPRPDALDASCLQQLGSITFLTTLPPQTVAPAAAPSWRWPTTGLRSGRGSLAALRSR